MSSFEEMLADPNEQFDRRSELLKSITEYANAEPCAASGDPFAPIPPSPAESAQVDEGVALLTAAADRLERQIAEGLWSGSRGIAERRGPGTPEIVYAVNAELIATVVNADLVAWLRDAAREAKAVGANPWAVALARKIMGEGER